MHQDFQETRDRLHRFLLRRVGDPSVADGILQETLLRALEKGGTVRAPGAFVGWMFKVASNLVADHFRDTRRQVALPDDLALPEEDPDPLRALAQCLRPMVSRLPEPYRVAIELSELDGLPHKVVAGRLGLGISGVKSRVQRGRALLKEHLGQCCRLETGPTGLAGFEPRSPSSCPPDAACGP